MKYVEIIIVTILDSLEECLSTMTIAAGKRLLHVFYVTLAFLLFSLICMVLKIPTFVSWVEALIACVIVGLINCIDYMNKASINKIKESLKTRVNKQRE